MHYNPAEIEPKWQKIWEEKKAFRTSTDLKELRKKPKYYILDMFPYPSGAGLHVGHPEGYTATDVLARMKRMQGFHVLHPMGWDAFGLPAERAALRENKHPAEITKRNIDTFREQIKRLGFSYDWEREFSTTDVDYYKWTQWIFLKLYEKGLAYMAEVPVNWCPALGTVLANEEVKDGCYVETGDPVERRMMKQWMLKITAYAERLLQDLEGLDWPEGVKEMQRNWIGKSTGADIIFSVHHEPVEGSRSSTSHCVASSPRTVDLTVFTTRPDTLFGATYCVLAPEHPLVSKIVTTEQKTAVEKYVATAKQKTDLARTDLAKEKTGVFTGAVALHPVTGLKIPIWVADYVLMTYGTGAIMAVPAHDERDHEFAKACGLPIVEVISGGIKPVSEVAHTGDGTLVHSDFLNGLPAEEAKKKMIAWLETHKKGTGKTQYRLRDWLFSRQRYWGEPIPVVHTENGDCIPLSENDLPLTLPEIDEYRPTEDGQPPLARAPKQWREVILKGSQTLKGRTSLRETNTMPQWAGSCWYYLRYLDPKNQKEICSKELEQHWMPVDLYVGGVEHAVLHLLYARFWHKVLYDCGVVHTKEPFQRLFNQGMILAYSYRDARGKYYHPNDVESNSGTPVLKKTGEPLESQIEKMSKSKMNVVNPDEVIQAYGADAMRLYELFMGPLEATKPWQMDGVDGVYRFLGRVWRLASSEKVTEAPGETEKELWRSLHKTIKKVTEDTEGMRFNTAISQMMMFLNEATSAKTLPKEIVQMFVQLVSIYAPHIGEELWEKLEGKGLVCQQPWPKFNPELCIDDTVTLPIQVNGKLRDTISAPRDANPKTLEQLALASPKVQKHLEGKQPKKVIVVPNRLINLIV